MTTTTPKQKRYFHSWSRKTGEYTGSVKTPGYVPEQESYDYEEYEPPPRKDPDGWYLVSHRTGTQDRIFVLKEGTDIKNVFGKVVSSNWEEYTIVARIPHVEWVDGLPSF